MWLVAAELNSTDREHFYCHTKFYWMALVLIIKFYFLVSFINILQRTKLSVEFFRAICTVTVSTEGVSALTIKHLNVQGTLSEERWLRTCSPQSYSLLALL